MGSGQSSSGIGAPNKGSFSVDASGNISQPKARVPPQQQQQHRQGAQAGETNDSRSDLSDTKASQQQEHGHWQDSTTQNTSQLSTLNNLNQNTNDLGLSLEEADEVLTRMKAKYKPDAAEEAGQSRAKLDDIERNLLHCYQVHKDRTLACAKLARDYQELVRQHRSEFLQKQARSEPPISA